MRGRWDAITPLLGRSGAWARLARGCTGEAAPLYEAAARLGLGSVGALSGGATLLLDEAVGLELAEVRVRVRLGLEF